MFIVGKSPLSISLVKNIVVAAIHLYQKQQKKLDFDLPHVEDHTSSWI